jgi:hypothetical protein
MGGMGGGIKGEDGEGSILMNRGHHMAAMGVGGMGGGVGIGIGGSAYIQQGLTMILAQQGGGGSIGGGVGGAGGQPQRKKKRKKVVLTAEELERERELTRLRKCGRCGEPGHTVRTCMSTSHIDGETKLKGKELCVRCGRPMHVHDDGRECGYKTRMDGARIEAARADTRGGGTGDGKGKKRAKG